SLDDKFLDDATKAIGLGIALYCIIVVTAKGADFARTAGEEYQLQIRLGERPAIRKQLALPLDAGRRGSGHEILELVRIRKSDIDGLHAAHGKAAQGPILGIGRNRIILFYIRDQVINQDRPEIPIVHIVSRKNDDEGFELLLREEIIELDVRIQVIIVPTCLAPARAVQQVHG